MTEKEHSQLRIVVLIDDRKINRYINDYIKWCQRNSNIKFFGAIVCHETSTIGVATRISNSLGNAAFQAIHKLETIRIRGDAKFRSHLETFDVGDLDTVVLDFDMRANEVGAELVVSDIEVMMLKDMDLDLIVDFRGSSVIENILEISKFGLLKVDLPGPIFQSNRVTGFSEVLRKRPTTEFIFRLTNTKSIGGKVLMRGTFPTRHYFLLNQAALCDKTCYYLKYLTDWFGEGRAHREIRFEYLLYSEHVSAPLLIESIKYVSSQAYMSVSKKIRRYIHGDRKWHVAFQYSDWKSANLNDAVDIDNPSARYLADPFVVQHEMGKYIFAEDVDERKNIGKISVYRVDRAQATRVGIVIDEQFHLSFPFPFYYDGNLYICPESSANRDIRVYRCVEFPLKWELSSIIMTEVSAVDTILLEHGGKWWMLTNIEPAEIGDNRSELYIYSSDSPLSKSWHPHKNNPVIVDALKARNGGIIVDNDCVFRVSQRQGFDQYGKESQINRIITLNDNDYVEVPVSRVTSDVRVNAIATHHLHSNAGITVFDYLS